MLPRLCAQIGNVGGTRTFEKDGGEFDRDNDGVGDTPSDVGLGVFLPDECERGGGKVGAKVFAVGRGGEEGVVDEGAFEDEVGEGVEEVPDEDEADEGS